MPEYLSYTFEDTEAFISTFDELPLWSAPFGLLLLKQLELKPGLCVLDIGSGAGFPLMELAARLGPSCKLYGIDPWTNANVRARQKIKNYDLHNVEVIETSAEKIPFPDNSVDLIVSNLGINNFENPTIVFKDCHRVLKPAGKLALTTNLQGHWKEFYQVFYQTLNTLQRPDLVEILKQDEERRGTVQKTSALFEKAGFHVSRHVEESFEMKFLDGSAFLNHYFVKLGWLTTWMKIFPKEDLPTIFEALEKDLNTYAQKKGELVLTVPMLYMEGEKHA